MADFSEWSPEASATTSASPPTDGTDIYVDPINGNDGADGSTPQTAKRSLYLVANDSVSVRAATTINLMEGVHDYTFTDHDKIRTLAYFRTQTGTEEFPITIQAMPGHEGRVILSGRDHDTQVQHVQRGIVFAGDHFHFKNLIFIDIMRHCIRTTGSNAADTNPRWGNNDGKNRPLTFAKPAGVVVENCVMWDLYNEEIVMCVRTDGGDETIVRNCFAGKLYRNQDKYQGYGFGMICEQFNERKTRILNNTTYWMQTPYFAKQQSCTAETTAEPLQAEIGYNYCERMLDGQKIADANNYCPPGSFYIHHNIFNHGTSDGVRFAITTSGSYHDGIGQHVEELAGTQRIEHNTILGSRGLLVLGVRIGSVQGNINIASNRTITATEANTPLPEFRGIHGPVDYNVYGGFSAFFRAFQEGVQVSKNYNFTQWQAATPADHSYLKVTNPDQNGALVTSNITGTLFNDFANRDFTNKTGSPAIGIMPDGSNAGAYQEGDEIIGARLPWVDLRQYWPEIPDWLNPGKDVPHYPYSSVRNPNIPPEG